MPTDTATRAGAKALILTVLGEFALPAGGSVWTATLVAAADTLEIGEKNARQAVARTADQGLICGERHGRSVRWSLTAEGRALLETGTERIYGFAGSSDPWEGRWLIANCQIAESQRAQRDRLRTQLGFLGFGELSPSLFVSPHPAREQQLRAVLDELDVFDHSVVMLSTMVTPDAEVVDTAWNLDELDAEYQTFIARHSAGSPMNDAEAFSALVSLVHDWRRFPSIDPELPSELLPENWSGARAAALFHEGRKKLLPTAQRWFADRESAHG